MGGQARISEAQTKSLTGWCVRSGVTLCVLFGSRADGSARPESDCERLTLPTC
jgi:predicted nucleotidyltransferase